MLDMIWFEEVKSGAVDMFPKSDDADKYGLIMPTAIYHIIIFFPKKRVNKVKKEKKLHNIMIEEKVMCLSFELVPETLPSVRINLRNNLALRCRITRLIVLTIIKSFTGGIK